MATKGIENEDIEIICEAIVKPTDDMELRLKQCEELKGELERCPTINELNNSIKRSKKGKAGGPTGLTYNLLKLASKEIINDIYSEMVELWKNELEIADFWQNRWLKAVSKGDYQIFC